MRKRKAFTYIEMIIYIAVLAIVMGGIVQFAWVIIEGGSKNGVQQEVSSQARYVSEKLKYEIRNAVGLNDGTSNFDVNLAINSVQQLSLVSTAPDDPILINVLNGKIQIKKGSAAAVTLNSADTTIQDLTFTNYSSPDNKSKNISFTLTILYNTGSARADFQKTITLRSDAEIRSL